VSAWHEGMSIVNRCGGYAGGNPDSNTLLSDMTTVICLDDYHALDRYGRKDKVLSRIGD